MGYQNNKVVLATSDSDLMIEFTEADTLVFSHAVTDDIQFPIASGKVPAANFPNWEQFGTFTNQSEYAFSVNDFIDCIANEPPHGVVEESSADVHMHITIKTLQNSGSTQYLKFTVWVALINASGAWEETTLTNEVEVPNNTAAMTPLLLRMGSVKIGKINSQMKVRVKRIAATSGTEYLADVYLTQVGMHVPKNQLGSRLPYMK